MTSNCDTSAVLHSYLTHLGKADEKFAKEVEKYPHLYVTSHKHFRNRLMKDYTWKAIAAVMNWTVPDCQRRWKSLRDRFARERRTRKNHEYVTADSKDSEEWHMMEILHFLDGHVKHRSGIGHTMPGTSGDPAKDLEEFQAMLENDSTSIVATESLQGFNITGEVAEIDSESDSNAMTQQENNVVSIKRERLDNDRDLDPDIEFDHEQLDLTRDPERKQNRKKARKDYDEIDATILKTLKELGNQVNSVETSKYNQLKLDGDELFCLSLADEIRNMNEKQKSYTKMSIQKLLFDVKYGNIRELQDSDENS